MITRESRRAIPVLLLAAVAVLSGCYPPRAARSLAVRSAPSAGAAGIASSGGPVVYVASERASVAIDARDVDQLASALRTIVTSRVTGVTVERVAGVSQLHLDGWASGGRGVRPLFVIDGVPLADEFALTIPTSIVERVDLVTDSLETLPYGPRGKAGVVLVSLRGR